MNTLLYFLLLLLSYPLSCFAYGYYLCKHPGFKDPLVTKLNLFDLDGWSIVHFLQFFLVAAFFPYPKYMIAAFVLGIVWEGIEYLYGKYDFEWLKTFGNCKPPTTDQRRNKRWWYGKISDVFLNLFGLIVGYYFRTNCIT